MADKRRNRRQNQEKMSCFTFMLGNETTDESSATDSEIDILVNQPLADADNMSSLPHTRNYPTLEEATVIVVFQMFAEDYYDETSQIESDIETPTTEESNDEDAVLHNELPGKQSLMSKLST
ncbi:hypothetical protein OUZ56_012192 [Daphnia magna]|uniref:Uncharacterized protein n=1 Tax=Daphnia magna TaxID=35525 RepID=A0ABQ9Z2B0_9CRUS|nr:hypothetical protein OUZ56_012192 [Daphnia magna]